MLILVLLGMYLDASVVFVKTFSLLFRLALAILCTQCVTTLVLCRQSPLNLHQFCLTRDSKYGLVGTDRNAICRYFALIRLYLALFFITKPHSK